MDLKRGDEGADTDLIFQFCSPYQCLTSLQSAILLHIIRYMNKIKMNFLGEF